MGGLMRELKYSSAQVYASGTIDFFRWKMLRVRDLLRGLFFSSPA
jgi:hypothetical protein